VKSTSCTNDFSSFAGVLGTGVDINGVVGTSSDLIGVYGQSGKDRPLILGDPAYSVAGVVGASKMATGVYGVSNQNPGGLGPTPMWPWQLTLA